MLCTPQTDPQRLQIRNPMTSTRQSSHQHCNIALRHGLAAGTLALLRWIVNLQSVAQSRREQTASRGTAVAGHRTREITVALCICRPPAAVPSEHRDGVLTCSHPKHLIVRLHWASHLSKLLCAFLARANVPSTSMRECFAEQLQRVDRISRAITVRRASKRSGHRRVAVRVGKKLRRAHTVPYYRPHTGHV